MGGAALLCRCAFTRPLLMCRRGQLVLGMVLSILNVIVQSAHALRKLTPMFPSQSDTPIFFQKGKLLIDSKGEVLEIGEPVLVNKVHKYVVTNCVGHPYYELTSQKQLKRNKFLNLFRRDNDKLPEPVRWRPTTHMHYVPPEGTEDVSK